MKIQINHRTRLGYRGTCSQIEGKKLINLPPEFIGTARQIREELKKNYERFGQLDSFHRLYYKGKPISFFRIDGGLCFTGLKEFFQCFLDQNLPCEIETLYPLEPDPRKP